MLLKTLPFDALLGIIVHLNTISLLRLASVSSFLRRLVHDFLQRKIQKIKSMSYLSLNRLKLEDTSLPSTVSSKDLFQPIILISCGNESFLFDIQSQTFAPSTSMRQTKSKRYYYGVHCLPTREVIAFSSPYLPSSGRYSAEVYSHLTRQWTVIPLNLSNNFPVLIGYSATYAPQNQIVYISGGYNTETAAPSPFLYLYDLSRHIVLLRNHLMFLARDGHASILYHDTVLIAGGFAQGRNTNSVEAFHIPTQQFVSFQSMCRARYSFTLLLTDTYELIAVGGDEGGTIECFDSKTDCWYVVASIKDRRAHAAVCYYDSTLFFFGGSSPYHHQERATWDAFDIASSTWASSLAAVSSSSLFSDEASSAEHCSPHNSSNKFMLPIGEFSNGFAVVLKPFEIDSAVM